MILILTNKLDFAVDYTILRLEARGLRFLRINSEDLGRMQFTLEVESGRVHRRIRTEHALIDLSDVTGVWLRRQMQVTASWVAPEARSYTAGEFRFFLDGFFAESQWRWVNPPAATYRAERKIDVLGRALRVGLDVPRTLATNDTAAFRDRPVGKWIAKPIYHGVYEDGRDLRALYTQRLDAFGSVSDDEIRAAPCIYQEEIQRGRDLRVTIIGDRIFGATVEWNATDSVDWRRPENQPRFHRYELPPKLASACRALMEDLGLVYGALDFIEDPSGRAWFLEVNPAGEFAWLELQLGFAMRDALIDILGNPQ